MPEASGLEAAIVEKLGIQPELIKGDRGVFDVAVDGEVIFSKHSEGRFPEHPEIISRLADRTD